MTKIIGIAQEISRRLESGFVQRSRLQLLKTCDLQSYHVIQIRRVVGRAKQLEDPGDSRATQRPRNRLFNINIAFLRPAGQKMDMRPRAPQKIEAGELNPKSTRCFVSKRL